MAGKSKYIVAAISTAVVAGGAFAAYTFLLKGPSGDASGALASAKIVPSEAIDPQSKALLSSIRGVSMTATSPDKT